MTGKQWLQWSALGILAAVLGWLNGQFPRQPGMPRVVRWSSLKQPYTLVDPRTDPEFRAGHLPGGKNCPSGGLWRDSRQLSLVASRPGTRFRPDITLAGTHRRHSALAGSGLRRQRPDRILAQSGLCLGHESGMVARAGPQLRLLSSQRLLADAGHARPGFNSGWPRPWL